MYPSVVLCAATSTMLPPDSERITERAPREPGLCTRGRIACGRRGGHGLVGGVAFKVRTSRERGTAHTVCPPKKNSAGREATGGRAGGAARAAARRQRGRRTGP